MALSIIVALAKNNVIGVDNNLPWHLPADLKYFKVMTMGKPIIMGRKTFQSIGRPLPGRRNIVVTRNKNWHAEGIEVAHSAEEAAALADDCPEAMVIGGAQIYNQMMPLVDRLYVTEVDLDVAGDTHFPGFSFGPWREVSRDHHEAEGGSPAYSFVIYERC